MKNITMAVIILVLMIAMTTSAFANTGANTSTPPIETRDALAECETVISINYMPDGNRIVTSIIEESQSSLHRASNNTKSGSKKVTFQNGAGDDMWYVKVKGVFTYDGSSAICTSSTVEAVSLVTPWKISGKSASKSGATASAKATGKQYSGSSVISTITRTVKLTCSSKGILS